MVNSVEKIKNSGEHSGSITFTLTPREMFLQNLYIELSTTTMIFILFVATLTTYFFQYSKIPQNDYFMLSLLAAQNFFSWISWIGGIAIVFNLFKIYSKNAHFKSTSCVFKIDEKELSLESDNEKHTFEYRYVSRVLSTWTSYIIEVDSIPRMIIPKKGLPEESRNMIFSVPVLKDKIKKSYRLIIIVMIYFVSTAYYFSMRDHKYYFVSYRSHSFSASWDNETLFVQAGRGERLYFESYKKKMFNDYKNDSVQEGFAQKSFFWVISKGILKKIDVPENESLGINLQYEGTTYFISYGRGEEQNIYKWNNEKLELEKASSTLIKEIHKKKREEMKKKLEENEDAEPERSYISEWEILGRNKQSGEKEIKVGLDSYVIKVEKIPVDDGQRSSAHYSLIVKWTSGDNSKEFPLLKFKEGEARISEMEYFSIIESAGKAFEKY